MLSRFFVGIDEAAAKQSMVFSVKTTADKKAGDKRVAWFEGIAESPVHPHTSDLNGVPVERRIDDYRGQVLGKPVLLVTFNEHETRALLAGFGAAPAPDFDGPHAYTQLGVHGGQEVIHVLSKQGRKDAQATVSAAIARHQPSAVIAVGIACGANKGKQAIGDVLVSEYLCDYESARLNADGSAIQRGARPPASPLLLGRVRVLDQRRGDETGWPTVHIGALLCGDKLIDDPAVLIRLKAWEPEAIGIEMEAAGIEKAASAARVDWIVIKGISDWGDGRKNTKSKELDQRRAADNAVRVVKALLETGNLDPAPTERGQQIRWIAQGAVAIFDGLDEVLVKLSAADGQVFTNNLLKLLADATARAKAERRPLQIKMLVTCRTQYFPTLKAQNNHFTQTERGEFGADHYRAMLLLPWGEGQVSTYLAKALPEMDTGRLLEMVRSVHNLEELTQRPYTLKLVAEFIPDIEPERAAGRTVYGVTLYRKMAEKWLARDSGKHHIGPEHKLRLAAHLAAHLWQSGRNALPVGELNSWFHAWQDSEPDLQRRYTRLDPEQLEEDLRTATFLARRDDGEKSAFRFAHTSLQEFFLATYLLAAVRENRPGRWAMRTPSSETLDFFGPANPARRWRSGRPASTAPNWRKRTCCTAEPVAPVSMAQNSRRRFSGSAICRRRIGGRRVVIARNGCAASLARRPGRTDRLRRSE